MSYDEEDIKSFTTEAIKNDYWAFTNRVFLLDREIKRRLLQSLKEMKDNKKHKR